MMRVSEAAQALGVNPAGGDGEFAAVSTDSRSVKRGDLFVALKGERFDAHDFVAQAVRSGAAAVMVDHRLDIDVPQIVVDDTTHALGALAKHWRRRFDIPLVAVTGSNGKTTVKEMLAAILREAAQENSPDAGVLATQGNLNNHIGVPLTLLELRESHRYGVIEMGMNHAGEIRYISGLAAPTVALINNAGVAHIENLGSREAIARAKAEIFEGLRPGGTAVINADDKFAPLWRAVTAHANQIDFGLEVTAAVTATYKLRALDSEIVLSTPLGHASAVVTAPGLHNVRNALAASAAATALNLTPVAIAAGLARFGGAKGRLQEKRASNGATIIDDTYNANPDSMRAAIDVLVAIPSRTLLVIGDMGELGADAPAMHAQIGDYARAHGVTALYGLGELSALAVQAFGAGACHFATIDDLIAQINSELSADMTVLVKGSRFMRMERVVAAVAAPGEERGVRREVETQ